MPRHMWIQTVTEHFPAIDPPWPCAVGCFDHMPASKRSLTMRTTGGVQHEFMPTAGLRPRKRQEAMIQLAGVSGNHRTIFSQPHIPPRLHSPGDDGDATRGIRIVVAATQDRRAQHEHATSMNRHGYGTRRWTHLLEPHVSPTATHKVGSDISHLPGGFSSPTRRAIRASDDQSTMQPV
jgi:hypothetical protein